MERGETAAMLRRRGVLKVEKGKTTTSNSSELKLLSVESCKSDKEQVKLGLSLSELRFQV